MLLKRTLEFDCTGSDVLSADLAAPFRRAAFQVRRQNGMPRAVFLSLLVHASVGAVLFFQLVPQQFMRMSGSGSEQKLLEVVLISEQTGGNTGSPAPAQKPTAPAQPVPKAAPVPVSAPVSKPRPAVTRQALPASPPAYIQEGQESDGNVVSDAGSSQTSDGDGKVAGNGQSGTGSGGGSSGPYDTSFGQADAPRFLDYIQPKYPLAARQQGREGTVVLRLTIDEKGNLVQVEVVSSSSDGFAEAAVEAVKRSTFSPAQRNGKTVAARAVLPVRFALRR